MMNSVAIPIITGLAIGIGFIVLFGLSAIPVGNNPDVRRNPDELPEIVWMGRSPTQCAEPWDSDAWRLTPDGESRDTLAAMTVYLENQGVAIHEIRVVGNSEFDGRDLVIFSNDIARCEGCQCLGWNTVFALVSRADVDKMQNEGFSIYHGNFTESRS